MRLDPRSGRSRGCAAVVRGVPVVARLVVRAAAGFVGARSLPAAIGASRGHVCSETFAPDSTGAVREAGMKGRLSLLLLLFGIACPLAASAAVPGAATATLVKAMPLAIDAASHGGVSRSFTLTYRPQGSARVTDHGSAARFLESQTAGRLGDGTSWRHLSGSEVLIGARGTLTLRWTGSQHRRNGRWCSVTGSWWIISGTGAYANRAGRGSFVSGKSVTAYRGSLMRAV
jgi:hypothetical protein